MKAIIISGLLTDLSDNIIPFLDKETDLYVHTWNPSENLRWITKLNRYRKYCRNFYVEVENYRFDKKLYSYFYSTWKVVNMLKDIDQYQKIIKFKPNIETNKIEFVGDIDYYFSKASIQSRPLLNKINKEDCLFGPIYYKVMDERIFSGYPLAFKKAFHILYDDLVYEMENLDSFLQAKYEPNYEGSIFWMYWFEKKGITLINDLDLKLANNKVN